MVLIHGLWLTGVELAVIGHRLRKGGFTASQFVYRTVADSLADNMFRLKTYAEGLAESTVHLVGHSLGGVLAVKMVTDLSFGKEGRVVTLGSPLKSSMVAQRLARWKWGRSMLGDTGGELLDTGLVEWSQGRELGSVAGELGVGVGRLLGQLPKPHDGTVTVEETRLPGITDHIVLPVTHTSILFKKEAIDQVLCFLKQGRFHHSD